MKYKFSLIMATQGRDKEIGLFLESIKQLDYNLQEVQIIIVDQNDVEKINLEEIISEYTHLNIVHVRSNIKGLSYNRNIGLGYAEGEYIAYPDDDCEYYPNTLKEVEAAFQKNPESNLILGRIIDKSGNDVIRKWSKQNVNITKNNFFTKVSSITMFLRSSKDIYRFNERLGVGTYFGSCEDTDIVYRYTISSRVIYSPKIEVYHPHPNQDISVEKIKSYSLGFGGFIKSNLDFHTFVLFFKVLVYHMLKLVGALMTLNKNKILRGWNSVYCRMKGFLEYTENERE
ncbi:TPA: glycosyltransferase family 2 protein [Bacillus cereus]|nr:glycosyltransferase family 2 protein [Bacillus cereus]